MFIAHIPRILRQSFKSLTWEILTEKKEVFLTFDDGPTADVTEWVLEELDKYNARATFFCLGKNVEANPVSYNRILQKGHLTGNHSYSHLKGFRTSVTGYRNDIDHAATFIDSKLFRPPYGRILPKQVKQLRQDYRIVMWTVLSVDYNPKVSGEQVVKNVLENVSSGSIIVFHDSLKASGNLYYALPKVLEFLKENGYKMSAIDK